MSQSNQSQYKSQQPQRPEEQLFQRHFQMANIHSQCGMNRPEPTYFFESNSKKQVSSSYQTQGLPYQSMIPPVHPNMQSSYTNPYLNHPAYLSVQSSRKQ